MNESLLLLIFLLALCQPSHDRMLAALVYGVVNLGHWGLISWWVNDFGYYTTAATASFLVVYGIKKLPRITSTAASLALVSLVEVAVNFFGLVLWATWREPDSYNLVFTFILAWAVIILLRRDEADELGGGFAVGGWGDYLRVVAGTGVRGVHRDSRAATK